MAEKNNALAINPGLKEGAKEGTLLAANTAPHFLFTSTSISLTDEPKAPTTSSLQDVFFDYYREREDGVDGYTTAHDCSGTGSMTMFLVHITARRDHKGSPIHIGSFCFANYGDWESVEKLFQVTNEGIGLLESKVEEGKLKELPFLAQKSKEWTYYRKLADNDEVSLNEKILELYNAYNL